MKLYNDWDSARAGEEAERLNAALAYMMAEKANSVAADPGDGPGLTTFDMGDYKICGSLAIPAIQIELAVISEWSYDRLKVSACRYYGTPDTQMMIMAHNYNKHFGRLNRLAIGDAVVFTDLDGREYAYRVSGSELWATDQLKEAVAGDDWNLTLFTCTYGGKNRVVVRCVSIN